MTPMIARRLVVAGLAAALAAATTAAPAAGVAGFGDVEAERFFTVPVQWMVDEDITTGTQPTCFSPFSVVTRGQAAAFIWRMEGQPPPTTMHRFLDVFREYQQDPVSWMDEEGITTGTSPTTFSPERPLTRGEFATFLWRLAGEPAAPPHSFDDVVLDWQQGPVSWMDDEGITTGTSPTTFSPERELSRGEAATFLYRYKGSPVVGVDYTHPTSPVCAQQVAPPASSPMLAAAGTILTRPIAGSSPGVRLFDGEGMAYVPSDGTIWVADDNADPPDPVLHEIDATTGAYVSSINLYAALPPGEEARAEDIESIAHVPGADPADDVLYAFSGTLATMPTAFRLTRSGSGDFELDSYQSMPDGADAAAARPDGSLIIVQNDITAPDDLYTYDYATNTVGPGFSIPGVRGGIWGLGFSDDGSDLWIGNDVTTIYRVDWATRTLDEGYRFSLESSLAEPTAVEPIGSQLLVLDGNDLLDASDPLKYAVHRFAIAIS